MNTYEQPKLPFGAKIDGDGIWCQLLNRVADRSPRPTLFLDRDGVIVEEVHYLHRPKDVRLIDGAAEVIAKANANNIPVIVVTNQAGIGYGKFGWPDFIAVQEKILDQLDAQNAFLNGVFACPFHAKGKPPYQHPNHPCRKPNSGMLEKAAQWFSINRESSWIIGDRAGDLKAGKNAGLAGGIHVFTGHGNEAEEVSSATELQAATFKVCQAGSIKDARQLLEILN